VPDLAFLIDENLTPDLAEMARQRGHHGLHVVWVGRRLRGRSDDVVARYALARDMVLVTNNLVDFRRIYRRRDLHPGIIFLSVTEPDIMDREAQCAMFEAALESIEKDEPINEAVTVVLDEDTDGNWEVTVARTRLAARQ
jgi:predicted nuclease of predicted toxin-antitoxin system